MMGTFSRNEGFFGGKLRIHGELKTCCTLKLFWTFRKHTHIWSILYWMENEGTTEISQKNRFQEIHPFCGIFSDCSSKMRVCWGDNVLLLSIDPEFQGYILLPCNHRAIMNNQIPKVKGETDLNPGCLINSIHMKLKIMTMQMLHMKNKNT